MDKLEKEEYKQAELKRTWKIFLSNVDKSETAIAKELGMKPTNLNRKINEGTIKFLELAAILEKYGYCLEVKRLTQKRKDARALAKSFFDIGLDDLVR